VIRFCKGVCAALCLWAGANAQAQSSERWSATSSDRWPAPFGGRWNAQFTAATDYSYAGISNTQRQPAFQVSLDYSSPLLLPLGPPLWLYVTSFGSNVKFPGLPPGIELDVAGGMKINSNDRKFALDVGYQRYLYPYYPASAGYEYGETQFRVDYDFGPVAVSGRLRWSPNSFANSGTSLNKRALVSAPLDFLKLPGELKLKAYGSLGNFWVEKPAQYGIPGNDYWFWQLGLVTSVLGLDVTLAYTGTSIDYAGCGNTDYCAGRALLSVTKAF
jgi:uncharacterized protein (TIGR02001 family)